MKLKSGVRVSGVEPEILLAIMIAEPILKKFNQDMVITSITDGHHSRNSKHYLGQAIDIRTWALVTEITAMTCVREIREALGEEYFVQLESDHIHLQFNGVARD